MLLFFFFFNDTATTEIYTLSLHDALPILPKQPIPPNPKWVRRHAHIDEQRTPPDVLARQEPPEAAVVGLVAVVPHHPVVLRRHDDRSPVVRRRMIVVGISTNILRELQGPDLTAVVVIRRRTQRG